MQCILPVLLLVGGTLASPSPSPAAPQAIYQQCGGINWTGGTTCASGTSCVYSNPYYSQCLPGNEGNAVSSAAAPSPAAVQSSTDQAIYEQCGGINWTGSTTCVSGTSCQVLNPYYSQCLPPTSSASSTTAIAVQPNIQSTPTTVATTTSPPASVAIASSQPAAPSASPSTSPATSSTGIGPTYKTTVTHYGAGDSFGSPNCNTATAACGFFTSPGFAAAASQNLFGVGPGAGAGPACGTCWRITAQTDSSGNALSNAGNSIVVMVNNLCPAQGNPLCSQPTLQDVNQYGGNVNFDLCSDSGASAALFGNDGVGLAVGEAAQVSCSEYSGTVVH